jgi:hypothetical protein
MLSRAWGPARPRSIVAATVALAVCGAGCDLIAGITDGVLVDAGADGARPRTDGGRDATAHEGGKLRDGGSEGSPAEGAPPNDARDEGLPRDAGHDAGRDAALPTLSCSLIEGSKVKVDDLSRPDAGSTNFNNRVYLAPNGGSSGFLVVAQISSQLEFLVYTVDGQNISATSYPGSPIDVHVSKAGLIEILTSNANEVGLLSGTQALTQGAAFLVPPGNNVGARLDDLPGSGPYSVGYALTGLFEGSNQLLFGVGSPDGGPAPVLAYQQGASFGFTNNSAFFANGSDLYALMNQIQVDAGVANAEPEYAATDTLSDAGFRGVLDPPTNMGALIAARTSVTDPSKVIVLGATVGAGGNIETCAATVAPSMIPHLQLCGPQFNVGSSLSASNVSFGGNGGSSWNPTSDDFVSVGPTGNGGGILLLWLAGSGRAVVSQLVIPQTGPVQTAGARFDNFVTDESTANVEIAWIEQDVSDAGGVLPETLYAASLNCVAQDH